MTGHLLCGNGETGPRYIGKPMTPTELKDYLTTLGIGAGAAGTLTALFFGAYLVVKWCAGAKRAYDESREEARKKEEYHDQQSLEWEQRFISQRNAMEQMQSSHITALTNMIEERDKLHREALKSLEQRHEEKSAESERRCNERLDAIQKDYERDREEILRGLTTIQASLISGEHETILHQIEQLQKRNQPTKGTNGNA